MEITIMLSYQILEYAIQNHCPLEKYLPFLKFGKQEEKIDHFKFPFYENAISILRVDIF